MDHVDSTQTSSSKKSETATKQTVTLSEFPTCIRQTTTTSSSTVTVDGIPTTKTSSSLTTCVEVTPEEMFADFGIRKGYHDSKELLTSLDEIKSKTSKSSGDSKLSGSSKKVTPISKIVLAKYRVSADGGFDHIKQYQQAEDLPVCIIGWVDKVQVLKKNVFLEIRDGPRHSDRVQVVISRDKDSQVSTKLIREAYVKITGIARELPTKAKSFQVFEIHCTMEDIVVLSESKVDYSTLCPPDAGAEVKLKQRLFYLRDPEFSLRVLAREALLESIRAYMKKTGCTEILPPLLVGNQCEGGATLFRLKHPARETGDIDAYLTQSSQFYLEYCVPSIGDCGCIAESFRAEKSHTRRHLTEFSHAEFEWKNVFTYEDHADHLKELMTVVLSEMLGRCTEIFSKSHPEIIDRVRKLRAMCDDILMMTHAEAIKYCHEHEIYKDEERKVHFGARDDIPEAQERKMIDQIGKIVFLGKFPKEFKSFYMGLCDEDPTLVQGIDVEVPGVGEIVGSGKREGSSQRLVQRLKEEGLRPDDYKEYIELREYGFAHTSGCGLGVDRMLTWILGVDSIREVVTFPRFPGYIMP